MCNHEGYSDRTADTAIARVTRYEKRKKKEEQVRGTERRTKTEKSHKE